MVRGVADRPGELQLTKIIKPFLGYRFSSRKGSSLLPANPIWLIVTSNHPWIDELE
jgi:hypothetical protein